MEIDHASQKLIEAGSEADESDFDSIYESETGSLTDTLASYVTKYKYVEGRRFDSKQQYIAPNDETQQSQLDLFHEIYFRILGNKLYLAPIVENPQRILDLGTGTGIWAIDFANADPSAAVIGTDISPIQPAWCPKNCEFQVADFNQAFTFTEGSFDFVHARALHGSVKDWIDFLGNINKILKPGGWVEIVGEDVQVYCDDDSLPKDSPIQQWLKDCVAGMEKLGLDLAPYHKLKDALTDAGFDMMSYKHEIFPAPIGTWPRNKAEKEVGGMMLVNLLQGIQGWSVVLYKQIYGKSDAEFDELLNSWYADLRARKQHKYFKINVIYAQKPEV